MRFGVAERATLDSWAHAIRTPLAPGDSNTRFIDLSVLNHVIGNANIVALGEGAHGISEPLDFRNHWFQFLVEKQDFRAIALESGLAESRIAYHYVQGGEGELAAIMPQSFSWGFDQFPQNRALIEWMRAYNARSPEAHKVNFYGFDISGSPGLPTSRRGLETALVDSLDSLSRMDPDAAATFRSRVAGFLPYFRFDYYAYVEGPNYDRLTSAERDALSAIVSDLVRLLESRRHELTELSSAEDYDWAHQAAIGARQVDAWMRQIPHGWEASLAQIECLDRASDLRDRAQADNIDWIVKRESTRGRVLIFGHNAHLSKAAVNRVWWPCVSTEHPRQVIRHRQVTAGCHLKRRHGKRLITIGHLVGHRKIEQRDRGLFSESIDEVFADGNSLPFLLDLRTAPAPVARILDKDARLGPSFELPGKLKGFMTLPAHAAFDALLYLNAADAS
jgi:erythromycin esterase